MKILITQRNSFLEAFGLDKGCYFFAEKLPNGNYSVWDGWESVVEVRKEDCMEIES